MNIGELTATMGIDTKNFDRNVNRSISGLKSLKTAIAALGIGALIYKLNQASKEWERLYKAQEQAEAGLRQVMKSMDRYADKSYKNMLEIAKMIQRTTTFGDEAVIAGTKMLMTYKDITADIMPRAIRAMADLSALTGRDMVASANLLGRAAMGLTGELRRVGITVDKATYESLGFLGLLKQIESQVQGQARALAQTKSGGLEQYYNIVGDLKEQLGELSLTFKVEFLPALTRTVNKISDWVDYQRELQETGMDNFFDRAADAAERMANAMERIVGFMPKLIKFGAMTMPFQIDATLRLWKTILDKLSAPSDVVKLPPISIYDPKLTDGGAALTPEGSGLNYYEYMASKKVFDDVADAHQSMVISITDGIKNWDMTFSSMLSDMVWGADVTFGDILKSFGRMLTQMVIQQQMAQPFLNWMSTGISNLFATPSPGVFGGEAYMPGYAWAKGGIFENNHILKYGKGGIINRPTIFPAQNGAVLGGEVGTEVLMPVRRMPGGDLGVQAEGGRGGDTYINIEHLEAMDYDTFASYWGNFAKQNPGAVTGPIQRARMRGWRG